ncbi:glutamate receptor-interacting protein 2-like isoform X1 [Amphiura filiformis]
MRGGINPNDSKTRPLTVTQIRAGGPADREGTLKVGDRVVSVDGMSFTNYSHIEAVNALKMASRDALFRIEYDVSIMEAVRNATGPLLVEVAKTPGANLGVTLTSATKHGKTSIVVDSIKNATIADRCGALHPGDEILSIDGTSTEHMSVPEATQLLATASEQIKLEMMPISQMTPRIAYARPETPRIMPNFSPMSRSRPTTPVSSMSYSSVSMGRLQNVNGNGNSRQQSSTLARKLKSRHQKHGSTISLTSTVNGLMSGSQVCHTDTLEVTLYSRMGDFGLQLQGGVFQTDILGSPAIIGYIEPGGKADKCGNMQVGDRLISINGTYTEDLTLEECNQLLRDSHQQCTIEVEYDVADSVVPSSGVFNIKLPITEAGLGITLSATRNRKPGDCLLISHIKKGSVAHRTGTLEPGDHLLAIDDIHLDNCCVEEAIHILRQADDIVKLRVKKDEAFSDEPEVSGAITYSVELVRHGGPLGITISGTEEPFDPILISGLTGGGLAERTGALHIGDRILAINGATLRGKTLSEAIRLLQSAGDIVSLRISKRDRRMCKSEPNSRESSDEGGQYSSSGQGYFRPVSAGPLHNAITSTPIGNTTGDSWDGYSGIDTGYHSNHTHYSRSMSLPANRGRRGSAGGSPRRQHRQRRIRSSSHSTSPNDASDEELDDGRPLGHNSQHRAYSSADPLSSEYDDERNRSYRHPHPMPNNRSPMNKHRDFLKQIEATFLQEDNSSDNSPLYSQPGINGNGIHIPNGDSHQSNTHRRSPQSSSDTKSSSLQIKSLEEVTDMFASNPQELHRVVMYKDSDVEDFGFSVSDGVYDKGVYINTVRPGGPGARNGNIKPFDRILQINQTRCRDLDCCMVVPLIAESGNKLELVLGRNNSNQNGGGPQLGIQHHVTPNRSYREQENGDSSMLSDTSSRTL